MTTDSARRELDVRGLEPPEPLQRALEALASLQPGEQLHMLIHREPFPLYAKLREYGFTHRTTKLADDCYEIWIRHA